MVGKKEYIQYFRMIPYIQPGDIRDAVEKESKKFKTPPLSSSNISPSIQSQSTADIQRQIAKSQSVSNQAKVKEFQTQIEWYKVQQKEAIERTAQLKSEMKRADIRDAGVKESKKVRAPKLNVQNITPSTQPNDFKQFDSDKHKAVKEANKTDGDSLKATIMAFKSHISDNNLRIKESAENIATIGLAKVRATRAINLEKYVNQNKAATHMTNELGRRVSFASDEKIRVDTEKAITALNKAFGLLTIAVSKDVQLAQNRLKERQASADISVDKSARIAETKHEYWKLQQAITEATKTKNKKEKEQVDAAKSLKRQKDKELNKYNGMSLPGIANKFLSEKIQIALTKGLGKIFTGSQGAALTSSLGKSIIAGVSTAASGAIIAAVAAGAVALVALMIAPFKLILSFSQKAFNFLKGISTQTETFKKLMELVMMPFMLMFTLLFAPVLMALAPLLATVIQSIASKQDAIMAVGAKIGLVIEKLFDDKMIETYIALIDQVVGAIDWFVDVVKNNLTIGNSIFETIVLTFTKVMSEVLVAITRWAYGPEGTGVINELATLIGTMIGITAAFVISLLPAIFSALEPSIRGIFKGVMQFIGDLFIAGIIDTFGIDSGLVAIIENTFSLLAEAVSAVATLFASPLLAISNVKDTIADIGRSFDNLMGSVNNYNSDNRVSNVDNTRFNFDISAGAGAGNLIDALTASLKLNGVI